MLRQMARCRSVAAAVVATFVLVAPAALTGRAADLQRKGGIKIDYFAVPETFAEAVSKADLVAVIKLQSKLDREVAGTRLPSTRFTAQVLEAIGGKGAASAEREIAVSRIGGFRKGADGGAFVEQVGFPVWEVGRTCLVFLGWDKQEEAYVLPHGPNGSFELDPQSSKARTFGHGRLAGAKNGQPFAKLLAEVRTAAK
jgi:hypothetical protein